jgi:hypothetical protein
MILLRVWHPSSYSILRIHSAGIGHRGMLFDLVSIYYLGISFRSIARHVFLWGMAGVYPRRPASYLRPASMHHDAESGGRYWVWHRATEAADICVFALLPMQIARFADHAHNVIGPSSHAPIIDRDKIYPAIGCYAGGAGLWNYSRAVRSSRPQRIRPPSPTPTRRFLRDHNLMYLHR